ncbi:MAG TPA: COX15/CtaA family protein [Acidimicrobiales bacterium]|nr:COX15/CtaA family protein [Acidimicrobiales bacterium]
MRAARLSPRAYERLTLVAAVAVAFIIVTGAAVRLTGSGLGCPDWPTCTGTHIVAALSYHQMVEFVNRTVTGAVSVVVILAVLGSMVRVPRRRDLTLLSWGLVAGVVGQIVLGGITVLVKLAPQAVMAHFLVSMALLADAVVLHHRAGQGDGPRRPVVDHDLVRLGRLMIVLTGVTIVLGTVVTSSGPHGGDPKARRFELSLHRVTQVHGSSAMLLLALVVATLVLLRINRAPNVARRRAGLVLEALAAQVAVGYLQYFTGVPVLLVGVHVAGAVVVWAAVLRYNLALHVPAARPGAGQVAVPRTAVLAES